VRIDIPSALPWMHLKVYLPCRLRLLWLLSTLLLWTKFFSGVEGCFVCSRFYVLGASF
jgi:hypothetical protein